MPCPQPNALRPLFHHSSINDSECILNSQRSNLRFARFLHAMNKNIVIVLLSIVAIHNHEVTEQIVARICVGNVIALVVVLNFFNLLSLPLETLQTLKRSLV